MGRSRTCSTFGKEVHRALRDLGADLTDDHLEWLGSDGSIILGCKMYLKK